MYETVKTVKGYEIIKKGPCKYFITIRVETGFSWSGTFRTIKAAAEHIERYAL